MTSSPEVLLGLDIGTVRVGVSVARSDVRIAQPLTTLNNEPDIYQTIATLAHEQQAGAIIAGWPRNLDSQATAQTAFVETFVGKLRAAAHIPVYLQDEALTSRQAESELEQRGKPYRKEDVDALAATYILQDFLQEHEAELNNGHLKPEQPIANGGNDV